MSCFGSGTIRKELIKCYGSPVRGRDGAHQVPRQRRQRAHHPQLFDTARQYRESIDVYGTKKAVEWPLVEHEPLVLHTAKQPEPKIPKPVKCPDFAKRLPKSIAKYTTQGVYDASKKTHLSFTQGSGHGGSHPHLAHEFAMALVEDRDPFPNARAIGQLDLRRPVRPRVGAERRRDRQAAGLHPVNRHEDSRLQRFAPSRRDFLKAMLAAGTAPGSCPRTCSGEGQTPPSGKINVGVIGVGAQGTSDMRDFLTQKDVRVTAICDVNQRNIDTARRSHRRRLRPAPT